MTFLSNESGVTAIEYGLVAALVAIAIIAALTALGDSLSSNFDEIGSNLDGAICRRPRSSSPRADRTIVPGRADPRRIRRPARGSELRARRAGDPRAPTPSAPTMLTRRVVRALGRTFFPCD